MNDKIFQLQQELIKTSDSFKEAILSEPNVEKHDGIINNFSKKEADLATEIEKETEKEVKKREKEAQDSNNDSIEEKEDIENTNNNHSLVNTFEKMYRDGATLAVIARQFRESELIEIGKEFGLEFTSAGTKVDKVKLIIEQLEKNKRKK